MTAIYLDPNQVPAYLRGGYNGKHLKAIVCDSMVIPMTAGLWDGGSRDTYRGVNLVDGRAMDMPGQQEAPWGNRQEHKITLQPGFAIVEHSIFCGKDMGLTFYVHPSNAAALLPAKADLSSLELLVLKATRQYKSSYMGRDRYEMTREDAVSFQRPTPPFPTREEWNAAKDALITAGYLNKAGAITNKGRNAI